MPSARHWALNVALSGICGGRGHLAPEDAGAGAGRRLAATEATAGTPLPSKGPFSTTTPWPQLAMNYINQGDQSKKLS